MNTEMIKMFDPTIDYNNHKDEYDEAIQKILNSGMFINGPEIKQLEKELESFCNVNHCIAVTNGTDALMIALMALDIGPGDEVITVPFTWISTAEVVCILGAKPVFVDIDDKTYNMDHKKLEEKITKKTKAIIPVSLYGQMADLEEIDKIASKYGITVIEDGAQSLGAEQNEHKSCSCYYTSNKISCTSFFPSKPLGCYGDGGACFTNDDELANKIRAIRTHGGIEITDKIAEEYNTIVDCNNKDVEYISKRIKIENKEYYMYKKGKIYFIIYKIANYFINIIKKIFNFY